MTWIATDLKSNTVYVDIDPKGQKCLELAPGCEPRMIEKFNKDRLLFPGSSRHILPIKYTPSSSEADGFTRLKSLLMDTTPAEEHQRYFIMCWIISIILRDYFRDRGNLQLVGGPAVGKSNTVERTLILIYGQSFWGQGTDKANAHLASVVPLLPLDNVENRNLSAGLQDFMLLSACSGHSGKFKGEIVKLNALCMLTSIAPFPAKYPELINRTYIVELKPKLKQPAFLHDQTMKLILQYRNQMLSDIFRLISLKVLPRLDRIDSWRSLIGKRHDAHGKERLNDHLAVILLILESLVEYLPIVGGAPAELQALAILDQWMMDWAGATEE